MLEFEELVQTFPGGPARRAGAVPDRRGVLRGARLRARRARVPEGRRPRAEGEGHAPGPAPPRPRVSRPEARVRRAAGLEPARPRLSGERRHRGSAPGAARALIGTRGPVPPTASRTRRGPWSQRTTSERVLPWPRSRTFALHEGTSPDGESRVADLLGAARVLSWPLVVDAVSGLILDGSHRAVVLARDFGARFAVVQRVDLDSPDVRIGTWCRVLEDVPAAGSTRRAAPSGSWPAPRARSDVTTAVTSTAGPGPTRRIPSRWPARWSGSSRGTATGVRRVSSRTRRSPSGWARRASSSCGRRRSTSRPCARRADGALLPPKSTRFLLPYRVLGLAVPLAALGGPRAALAAEVERERARPLACLGGGLAVDRRYPERLWQFADHRIPDSLFADEAGRHAYADALARAALPHPARPGQRRQG